MILLSDERFLDKLVEHILSGNSNKYVVVTNTSLARRIGQLLYSGRKTPNYVEIHVFKNNYPEENALKIIVYNSPDKIIDCDPYNELSFLKKLAQIAYVDKVSCGEALGY